MPLCRFDPLLTNPFCPTILVPRVRLCHLISLAFDPTTNKRLRLWIFPGLLLVPSSAHNTVPFPSNSVSLFVLICLVSTHTCPRLRLQPNPLVPLPRDSQIRPSPVFWIRHWISLDTSVCRLTTLDCLPFLEACFNKEYLFFIPEFRLAIGSCYPVITTTNSLLRHQKVTKQIQSSN